MMEPPLMPPLLPPSLPPRVAVLVAPLLLLLPPPSLPLRLLLVLPPRPPLSFARLLLLLSPPPPCFLLSPLISNGVTTPLHPVVPSAHLAKFSHYKYEFTPGIYYHKTRKTAFTLVVDEFGIKYNTKDDANHLLNCLR